MANGLKNFQEAVTQNVPDTAAQLVTTAKDMVVGAASSGKGTLGGVAGAAVATGKFAVDTTANMAATGINVTMGAAKINKGLTVLALVVILAQPVTNLVKKLMGMNTAENLPPTEHVQQDIRALTAETRAIAADNMSRLQEDAQLRDDFTAKYAASGKSAPSIGAQRY